MAMYFHGNGKKGPYFEGWYFKLQTADGRLLALIPALHIDREGRRSVSLQVLSAHGSRWLESPAEEFDAEEDALNIRVGKCVFTERELTLDIDREEVRLSGKLRFGDFRRLKSDIMGPFRVFSDMECAHGVISMGHTLEGRVTLDGEEMDFTGGVGYIETDRGRSFPSAYLWTQCVWQTPEPGSLMLSVATIPFGIFSFTGCICAIVTGGREYRLATYRGASAKRWTDKGALIRQGKYRLEVELLEDKGRPLRAPVEGSMQRTIHESLATALRYRFWHGKQLLLDRTDACGSFEYSDRADGAAPRS